MPKRNYFDTRHRQVAIRFTAEEYLRVKKEAEKDRRKVSAWIRNLIEDYLDKKK